jgi:hypothetical protein
LREDYSHRDGIIELMTTFYYSIYL